jgi:hypothetical protein
MIALLKFIEWKIFSDQPFLGNLNSKQVIFKYSYKQNRYQERALLYETNIYFSFLFNWLPFSITHTRKVIFYCLFILFSLFFFKFKYLLANQEEEKYKKKNIIATCLSLSIKNIRFKYFFLYSHSTDDKCEPVLTPLTHTHTPISIFSLSISFVVLFSFYF